MTSNYFDQVAATWDGNPHRVALTSAVGAAILRETRPTRATEVLDYGCGTGLISLFLLPHVRSVTGADSSPAMLEVLEGKTKASGLANMRTSLLDLERMPLPSDRYDLVTACMVLHHVANTAQVLGAFHELLRPGGVLCVADLDVEPGLFHDAASAASVHHGGFERSALKADLIGIGFRNVSNITPHTIRKPVATGSERDFPVFLMTAMR